MTGGFQPDKLNSSFGGAADGIYTRMLFAWPPEPAYQKLTDHVEEIEPELYNTLTRLIDLPAEQDNELLVSPVILSSDARGAFEDFRKQVHTGKTALDGHDREWWAKTPTHVLRLSGTLAYLDWARRTAGKPALIDEPNAIEARFVHGAVRLVRDYFWPHARAALRQIGLTERHAKARRVAGRRSPGIWTLKKHRRSSTQTGAGRLAEENQNRNRGPSKIQMACKPEAL